MYLISQIHKPGRNGGKYLCSIFEMINGDAFTVLGEGKRIVNCSQNMADRLGLVYSKGDIVIPHGSGTGVMVITALLEKYTGAIPGKDIFDVSVFN